MPFHPVTAALMYRGVYTIPELLREHAPTQLPEDEIEEIREAFKVFDRDGNGFISKQELGTAMRSLGYMPNEVELEVIIQRLDMDGDGQVDFEEFVTLLGPKITTSGIPDKLRGADFDTVFWKAPLMPNMNTNEYGLTGCIVYDQPGDKRSLGWSPTERPSVARSSDANQDGAGPPDVDNPHLRVMSHCETFWFQIVQQINMSKVADVFLFCSGKHMCSIFMFYEFGEKKPPIVQWTPFTQHSEQYCRYALP
ncbi:calcium-binding 7 [Pelobates cultripes]|uniref:Calcium-binding 7 n=1 Tax=Pelobates cultripes TaxID=61616 RepID=A0AAD1SDD5_PELCU|nr:calcium-binding 7 [Pelobates cultripes]